MSKSVWVFIGLWPLSVSAQVELICEVEPTAVFAARPQNIRVAFHNPTTKLVECNVQMQLVQLSSASAAPVGGVQPWKTIQILPQQTVLDTIAIEFPEVRAATRFRIELIGIGRMEAIVYPSDLLQGLNALVGKRPLGVLDPDGQLKPLLKQAGVEFADLQTEPATPQLSLVWTRTLSLPEAVASRVKAGAAALWIRPSVVTAPCAVHLGAGVVVIIPVSSLRDLVDSPVSQLNLIRYAELALDPSALRMPSGSQVP